MASVAPSLQAYVPGVFVKVDDPSALRKYVSAELAKLRVAIASLNAVAQPQAVTFANAPVNAPFGTLQPFSDSNTVVWGATIAGGGTSKVLGHWNGSAWTVAAI